MTLDSSSLQWAIDFVASHSDGDLFPRVVEIEAINHLRDDFVAMIEGKDLSSFSIGPSRRFIVPKDDVSYRQATQIDPQDSIILSAILQQFGDGIENRRRPRDQVFSYRFESSSSHGLYGKSSSWNEFWLAAQELGNASFEILYCDISDFYNQIYHHTIENQLIESGFPNQVTRWILRLLESTTAGVSRGIPVGPHGSHLLAEASLIPIDNSMHSAGIRFLRYSDDILIFSRKTGSSKRLMFELASILDRQQRLTIQRHKVRMYQPEDFLYLCSMMIEDRPISEEESEIVQIVKSHSEGDPYRSIAYNQLSPEEWSKITDQMVEDVISEYIEGDEIDYIRLRWFYRRLAQIGHPGAIGITIDSIDRLAPCLPNICLYLSSIQQISSERWMDVGVQLIDLLGSDEVDSSEFFRLSILSLFTRNAGLNHFNSLSRMFQSRQSACASRDFALC